MATFPDDQEWSVSNTKLDPLLPIQEISELQNSPSLGFGGENQLLQLLPIKANDGNKRRRERMLQEDDEFNWTLTSEEAFQGIYSIKSPELTSEGPNIASVTLNIANSNCKGPLLLNFNFKTACDNCKVNNEDDGDYGDVLILYFDDLYIGGIAIFDREGWGGLSPVYVEDGVEEITFEYYHNFKNSSDPNSGTIYIDEVHLTPTTPIPTYNPTIAPTSPPSLSPITAAPTPVSEVCTLIVYQCFLFTLHHSNIIVSFFARPFLMHAIMIPLKWLHFPTIRSGLFQTRS